MKMAYTIRQRQRKLPGELREQKYAASGYAANVCGNFKEFHY